MTGAGGRGIAARVDHTDEAAVALLTGRVRDEHGRLDILVNDIWGGDSLTEWGKRFWELIVKWPSKVQGGGEVRSQFTHFIDITPTILEAVVIEAPVSVNGGASGMILTQGGNTGGWAFYMADGKLLATHNFLDLQRYTVTSDAPVAAGEHELRMEFAYEGGKEMGKGGTVTLFVDGNQVGSGKVERTTPFKFSLSESQDIGRDTGTPVTYDYRTPFVFSGTLDEVVVKVGG